MFVLDVLGEINTIFQAKFGFPPNLWEFIPSLGQFFKNEMGKIQTGDFGRFPFLAEIGFDNLPQFVSILKHLIMNLSVRFYNMSFSLNRGSVKDHIDYDRMVILPGAPIRDGSRCGLSQLLEVFNINHVGVPDHLLGTFMLHGLLPEWDVFMACALHSRDEVCSSANKRCSNQTTREKKNDGAPTDSIKARPR